MKGLLTYILVLFLLFACKKDELVNPNENRNNHIEYFGFTLIDTYWDDPTDNEAKTNYADEIHSFSNLADILIVYPSDDIVQRATTFSGFKLKAILHLNELFFELKNADSPSGANYDLRADYKERWEEFYSTNQSILNTNYIGAFYIGEEPTWNGISYTELNTIAQLLKSEIPTVPLMIIEAYPTLSDLQIPDIVDWIGFDRYFIKNPLTNSDFQQNWEVLKSKLSTPNQRIMVVLDSHYIDWAHGDFGNITLAEMKEVATNYYELAKSEENVIGLLGYFWPSGFDFTESIGARGMPQHVKLEYERIGKEITGKSD